MTFVKYQSANNAQGVLHMPISSSATSLQLKSGQGDRFPSVFPYLLGVEQLNSLSAVIKREIVKVTNKVGDVLTIVRSAGTCLPDDESTTQGTQAFSFDADVTRVMQYIMAEQIDDIQDEVAILGSTKLNISDFQAGTAIYGASSTGNDDYAITLSPIITALTTTMVFRFKADVTNTGPATLNVCGLGAYPIKKLHDQDLVSGDIEANQIVTVSFDGSTFQMDSQVALIADNGTTTSLIAGENITVASAPIPVSQLSSDPYVDYIVLSTNSNKTGGNKNFAPGDANRFTQTFTATGYNKVYGCAMRGEGYNSGGSYITADVYACDINGKPTGSSLGTIENKELSSLPSSGGGGNMITWYNPTGINLTGGVNNKYAIVFRGTGISGIGVLYRSNSSSISGGQSGTSSDSGSTWTMSDNDATYFRVFGALIGTTGEIYKATNLQASKCNFVGFVKTTINSGSAGSIQIGGIVAGFTGLTPGKKVFLGDGIVTQSIPSTGNKEYSIVVGIATSSTEILIVRDSEYSPAQNLFVGLGKVTSPSYNVYKIPIPFDGFIVFSAVNSNSVNSMNIVNTGIDGSTYTYNPTYPSGTSTTLNHRITIPVKRGYVTITNDTSNSFGFDSYIYFAKP